MLLEVVADPDAYLRSVADLVTGPTRPPCRVAQAAFADVPFCLSFKCDGCLYNEFCMKDAAEREDLSLLPYMTGVEKEALRRAGVTTDPGPRLAQGLHRPRPRHAGPEGRPRARPRPGAGRAAGRVHLAGRPAAR